MDSTCCVGLSHHLIFCRVYWRASSTQQFDDPDPWAETHGFVTLSLQDKIGLNPHLTYHLQTTTPHLRKDSNGVKDTSIGCNPMIQGINMHGGL